MSLQTTFDFDSHIERAGHDALAFDALGTGAPAPAAPTPGVTPLPMWIADMNFAAPPCITDAIAGRLAHPTFGYYRPSDAYYQAICTWHRNHKGTPHIEPAAIGYHNGVLGGLMSALSAFANPGDTVLVHSPTYIGFTNALTNAGYHLALSPLVRDDQGVWRMDLTHMEELLATQHIHVAILCSPHNPTGRVWCREELEAVMALYQKYDCLVVSDEIWSDLTLPGVTHIPTQETSEWARQNTIALYAPSKTFNLAGLVGAYDVIYNPYLRDRVRSAASKSHYNSQNVLQMHALIGAYSEQGYAWLSELRQVIQRNVDVALARLATDPAFAGVHSTSPEGTYMLFWDCSDWCERTGRSLDWVLEQAWASGVAFQDGRPFHGPCHVRVNLALPVAELQEALDRLSATVFGRA